MGPCSTQSKRLWAAPISGVNGRARLQRDTSPWTLVVDGQFLLTDGQQCFTVCA